MHRFIFITLAAFLITACETGYQGTEGGLEYKIHRETGSPKPALGDIMKMHMVMMHGDSVFSDSRQTGPVHMVFDEPAFQSDILEGLALTGKGDSASFRVSADSLYGDFMPGYMEKGSYMQFHVRIDEIRNEEEHISTFMQNEGLDMQKHESGIYYSITREGDGPAPEYGDTVVTLQEGRLLNGKLFESTTDRGHPSELIIGIGHPFEGWDIMMQLMRAGDQAKFIVPYKLGYREGGSQEGVPPFATLYFEVELIEVRS